MTPPLSLSISLACNDDAGHFAGAVDRITFGLDLADLEGDPLTCTEPSFRRITIDGEAFISMGHIPWYGNICWHGVRLSLEDAVRLLETLKRNHWSVTDAESGIYRAYERGDGLEAALRQATQEVHCGH